MINDIYLIGSEDVIALYPNWNENIEPKIFQFPILISQDRFIRQSLGDDFYSDFIDKWEDQTNIPLTPEYLTLYNGYIKPLLVFAVLEECIFELQNQITNKGVFKRSADYSVGTTDENVYKLQYRYKDYREKYQKDLISFLDRNGDDYPLYKSGDCRKFKKNYFYNVYIKNRPVR
jgi:hypothetical protein